MKERKTEFHFFTIMEYEEEAAYLQDMRRSGWKLEKVTFPGINKFTRCQPEEVVYQLDYNQDGIANKEEYVQMFSDCGWEYLFDFMGYSYFCKSRELMTGREVIFCDDQSRLDMIKRIFCGRILPLLVIFLCVVIPSFYHYAFQEEQGVWAIAFGVFCFLYLALFVHFALQFYRIRQRLKR